MTVYDLMLRDIVRFKGLYKGVTQSMIGQVVNISDVEVITILGANAKGELEQVSHNIDYFEPVEITDDLLINNGFGEMETDFYTNFYYGEVGEGKKIIHLHKDSNGGYAVYGNRYLIINYLHELQHILKQIGLPISWSLDLPKG